MKKIIALLITLVSLTVSVSAKTIATNGTSPVSIEKSNAACSIELPDMITDFSAVRSNEYAILTWVIQNQEHADNFIIEKSTDSNNWTACATIPAHGNSASPAVYFYGDAHPAAITYYRLKQSTSESAAVYTDVVKVTVAVKKAHTKK